ncbi:hypothetical protein SD961_01375 [Erwinia sp. MMLR14_017]|nr:hypothetical protein [Erwinia sp. MMLR14_017]MDW8844554.1 hypothetical protein [Erwinia sp. MMLR14_017]
MKKLKGKVARITGAFKGIGAGIARQCAVDGANIIFNCAPGKDDTDRPVN